MVAILDQISSETRLGPQCSVLKVYFQRTHYKLMYNISEIKYIKERLVILCTDSFLFFKKSTNNPTLSPLFKESGIKSPCCRASTWSTSSSHFIDHEYKLIFEHNFLTVFH